MLIKTMLIFFHVSLGLSPVWNHYPKGSHMRGATKHSIIAYCEIDDSICKECGCLSTIRFNETIPVA